MNVSVNDRLVTSGRRAARRIAAILVTVLATLGLGVGAGLPAQAVATESITGTVTGPDGAPLSDAYVVIHNVQNSGGAERVGSTAADGTYTIGQVAGWYTVQFFPGSAVNLAPEYWKGAATSDAATPVRVTAGGTTSGIDAQLAVGGTITGTVTGPDGAPLSGVEVLVYNVEDHASKAGGSTAADGTYSINALPTGSYIVDFGSVPNVNLSEQYWHGAATSDSATPVGVTAGGTTSGIDAQLAVCGTITGTVTGPDGAPVADAEVFASNLDSSIGRSSSTASDGTYSIDGLPTGSYVIAFGPPSGSVLGYQFWHDATTWEAATLVSVADGATTPGINAQLAVAGTITGTVTGPDSVAVAGVDVVVAVAVPGSPWDVDDYDNVASTAADGTYTISGLAAGSYTVEFDPHDGVCAPEFWDNVASASTATPVVVGSGVTVSGIDARLEPTAGVLRGTVRLPGGEPAANVKVEALDGAGAVMRGERAWTDADGTYALEGLRAGAVKVAFARASGTTPYVAQYFDGAATVAAASTVSLTAGVSTSGIDAVLTTGASITGVVTHADGSPDVGRFVVAFTQDESLPGRSGYTTTGGSYVIEGLLPGAYEVAVASTGPTGWGTFYRTGAAEPAAGNVTVTGTATTRGIDIVIGVSEQPMFLDVLPGASFFADIQWLAGQGITKGSVQPDGSVFFDSAGAVRREAMAAFLYRFAGSPAFTAPAVSPFVDVATSATFYKEIAWLAGQGISTGTAMGDGTFQFRPAESVSREAMAAFLYRFMGRPGFTVPAMSPFVDVPTSATFYKEIAWLAANHISTGTDLGNGTFAFRPGEPVSREAMAAFLHRTSNLVP